MNPNLGPTFAEDMQSKQDESFMNWAIDLEYEPFFKIIILLQSFVILHVSFENEFVDTAVLNGWKGGTKH